MTLSIREVVIFLVYAIGINLVFASLSNLTVVSCPNLDEKFNEGNYTIGNVSDSTETKVSASNFINLILNRCDGLSSTVYWLFQVPTIIGLLYIIRGFIGLT